MVNHANRAVWLWYVPELPLRQEADFWNILCIVLPLWKRFLWGA